MTRFERTMDDIGQSIIGFLMALFAFLVLCSPFIIVAIMQYLLNGGLHG